MSTKHVFLLACILIQQSYCTNDLSFQIEPRPVRINNEEEIYVINDDNYIGQVLYRYDQIQLECYCQTQENHIKYNIYWTINNQIISQYNNSTRIQLIINKDNVQVPITYVTCICMFYQENFHEITKDYRYKLYIDLESEPSLEVIQYSIQTNMIRENFNMFLRRHTLAIVSLAFVIFGITCPLIIFNWNSLH